eukprot:gene15000-6154_t
MQELYDEEFVFSDDGESIISSQQFKENSADLTIDGEEYVFENIPLSYAICSNLTTEHIDHLQPDENGYSTVFRISENPRELINFFVDDLEELVKLNKEMEFCRYREIILYIKRYFAERKILIKFTTEELNYLHNDDFISAIDDEEEEGEGSFFNGFVSVSSTLKEKNMSDDDLVTMSKEMEIMEKIGKDPMTLIECYTPQIRMFKRFLDYISTLPVFGFNSSAYDIPLIKKELIQVLKEKGLNFSNIEDINNQKTNGKDLFVIKKQNKYIEMSVRIQHGRFKLLDLMQFLAPGFSLRNFIQSFAAEFKMEKFFFPYEYMSSYDVLKETCLPPYESFYSTLKQGNVLEEEYLTYLEKNYKVKKMLLNTTPEEVRKVDANLPLSGLEQYEMIKKKWRELGFKTLKDL